MDLDGWTALVDPPDYFTDGDEDYTSMVNLIQKTADKLDQDLQRQGGVQATSTVTHTEDDTLILAVRVIHPPRGAPLLTLLHRATEGGEYHPAVWKKDVGRVAGGDQA